MHPGRERGSELLIGHERAQWKAARKRLRKRHDVGGRIELLICEVTARAAQAALNFIGDERSVVLSSEGASALPEWLAYRENAAFALNRFDHNGADRIVKFVLEIGEVIEAHKFNARNQRPKRFA